MSTDTTSAPPATTPARRPCQYLGQHLSPGPPDWIISITLFSPSFLGMAHGLAYLPQVNISLMAAEGMDRCRSREAHFPTPRSSCEATVGVIVDSSGVALGLPGFRRHDGRRGKPVNGHAPASGALEGLLSCVAPNVDINARNIPKPGVTHQGQTLPIRISHYLGSEMPGGIPGYSLFLAQVRSLRSDLLDA